MLRIRADDAVDIPDVPGLHGDDVIIVLIVFLRHLHGILAGGADAQLPQFAGRPRVDRVSGLLGAGGRRGDMELVSQTLLLYHVAQDELRHGRAADIAVAHEKYFNHIYKSS